jgi:hypothetical protein
MDDGPRFPWTCACVDGAWRCTPGAPDGRVCGCTLNPPHEVSCGAPPAIERPVGSISISVEAAFPITVTLHSNDPLARGALKNSLSLFSVDERRWVDVELKQDLLTSTALTYSLGPRGTSASGAWVLRIAPPEGVIFATPPPVFCEGAGETRFTAR